MLRHPVRSGSFAEPGFVCDPAGFERRHGGFVRRPPGFVRGFSGQNV